MQEFNKFKENLGINDENDNNIYQNHLEYKKKKMEAEKEEKEIAEAKNRFLIIYLIFIQMLGEIHMECKERAVLLYKIFKLYFAEQEKKWVREIVKMKEQINIYKDICKSFISKKSDAMDQVEDINDVMFAARVTSGMIFISLIS